SRLDPPERLTIPADARLHLAAVAREWRPDLGIARKFKIGRHDADNYWCRAVASLERAAHNLRIAAIALLPEPVTEDDYLRPVQKSLFVNECPPEQRLHSEGHEEIDCHSGAGNHFHAL